MFGIIKRQNYKAYRHRLAGFYRYVIEVTDVKDESPNYGFGEDSITGEVEGREIMVPQSEIRDIEILGHDNPAYR